MNRREAIRARKEERKPKKLTDGASPREDLTELWKRVVFSIAVSNTDDHLRNHGFLLTDGGWRLSPMYDVNPSIYGNSLSLAISREDAAMDFELAIDTAKYYDISSEYHLVCDIIVRHSDGTYLLMQRGYRKPYGGMWEASAGGSALRLSHGDFCLPNLFFHQNRVSGYIDLGKTGIADKWCDIALCYRSLSHNYTGKYHNRDYGRFDDRLLFRELGIWPDWDKIRYYILLDELF